MLLQSVLTVGWAYHYHPDRRADRARAVFTEVASEAFIASLGAAGAGNYHRYKAYLEIVDDLSDAGAVAVAVELAGDVERAKANAHVMKLIAGSNERYASAVGRLTQTRLKTAKGFGSLPRLALTEPTKVRESLTRGANLLGPGLINALKTPEGEGPASLLSPEHEAAMTRAIEKYEASKR